MIRSELFFEIFFKKLANANEKLKLYLDSPTEENVHDVRTSIRRLETVYSVLPKSSKTKTSEKSIRQFKDFFSFNSKIRDYDVFLEKLLGYGFDKESELILLLQKKKLKRLAKGIGLAEKLSNFKKPKIKQKTKSNQKYEKKILSLISDFKEYIPVVIKDEENVEELHSMRKIIKKLRYVLELDPQNSYQKIISNMKQLQTFLGDVHDSDIFIWYLEKLSKKDTKILDIINQEKAKRSRIYKNLVLALSNFESIETN